ncbi:MAG: hypothetical protein EB127_20340, partial [Alphaproteobacteria bacterium]|nr:hypothetical protein [Alphaproteobacteria bacterium]
MSKRKTGALRKEQNHNMKYSQKNFQVTETIDFVTRELMGRIGGFYAALDADSDGVEGKFYTWDYEEIAHIAQEDMTIIQAYYGLKKEGNWEEVNILHRPKNHEILAQELNI